MLQRVIRITVPGTPVPKGRARAFVRNGHVGHYTPEKTARYENLVKLAAQEVMQNDVPLNAAVELHCVFTLPIPASYPKKRRQHCLLGIEQPCKTPDLDNLVLSVKDGCNGVVWRDDAQVTRLFGSKAYGEVPGALIEVITL